jgi:predicted MFS family arabinose efflux permease
LGYGYVEQLGPGLLALRVTHGIAVGALFSVLFTIAADVVPPERRAQGLALFGVSGMLPLALGGLMGDWILEAGDYGRLFSAIAVCAFVGLIVSTPIPETRREGGPKPAGFLAVALSPRLRPLWIVGLAFAFAIAAFFIFLKTWVRELGHGSLGDVFAWYSGTAIALRVFLGHIPERFGLKRVLFPALLMTCAGLFATGMAESAWMLNLAGVLCGLGHGYAFPIISALVVQRAAPEQRGSAVAMFTALFDLGALLGGPSLGYLAREAGYPVMFSVAAGVCLAATLLFAQIDRRGEDGL